MAYTRASLSGACCTSCAKGGSCLGETTMAGPRNMFLVAAGIVGVMYVLLRKK